MRLERDVTLCGRRFGKAGDFRVFPIDPFADFTQHVHALKAFEDIALFHRFTCFAVAGVSRHEWYAFQENLGKNRVAAASAGTVFSWFRYPSGRLFGLGPVLGDGGTGRRFEMRRSLPCLLVRVIEITIEKSGSKNRVSTK